MAGYIGNFPTAIPLSGTDIADGTITNDDLAGSIANNKLLNSSVTVNGTSIDLGASGNISAGITEADQWRVTTAFSGTSQDITANLSRAGAYIGTGMTQSSGVFTFPSTGVYHVSFVRAIDSRNVASNPSQVYIYQSFDSGSNWTLKSRARLSTKHSVDISWGTISCDAFLDVTDASTNRVKFSVDSTSSITTDANNTRNETYMTFIRLGDT